MAPNIDIATRALIVTLKSSFGGAKTTQEVSFLTGIPIRTINSIYGRAIERGFDPNIRPLNLKDEHLQDGVRLGRPSKDS